jgi:MFS family permease
MFDASQRGLGMALFAAAPFMYADQLKHSACRILLTLVSFDRHRGPALGPIVGGFLGQAGGWRWVAGLIAILTAILTAFGALIIPETYAPVLLRRRANLLYKATGAVYRSKFEKDKTVKVGELFKVALSRPWLLLFKEPIVLLLSI